MVAREHLLQVVLNRLGPNRRLVLIEAQAGQGKTTFAGQLAASLDAKAVWYGLGPEDNDPACFLVSFYHVIQAVFPGFELGAIDQYQEEIDKSPDMAFQAIDRLWLAFNDFVQFPCCLVMDDLHQIGNTVLLKQMLAHIAGLTTPHLYTIMISRSTLFDHLPERPPWSSEIAVRMDNEMLKFSLGETNRLMDQLANPGVDMPVVSKVHQITLGWPMGIAALCHNLPAIQRGDKFSGFSGSAQFMDYFLSEVFSHLPESVQTILLKLSLLTEIPAKLAADICPREDARGVIAYMRKKNLFLRLLNRRQSVYGFHHLFHEVLREAALEKLSSNAIRQIYQRAANWYATHGNTLKAIEYGFLAGDMARVNQWIETLFRNPGREYRTHLLFDLLADVSQTDLQRYEWICFWKAAHGFDKDTAQSIAHYYAALDLFKAKNKVFGQLLCSTRLIYAHVYLDARFNLLPPLLDACESLFERMRARLPPALQVQIAHMIALGHCFYSARLGTMENFTRIALDQLDPQRTPNTFASIRITSAYQCAFRGNWREFGAEIDGLYRLTANELLSRPHRQLIEFMKLDYLAVSGQPQAFWEAQADIARRLGNDYFKHSLYEPFSWLRTIDVLLSTARYDEALEKNRLLLHLPGVAQHPHVRNQALAYRTLLAAIHREGDKEIEKYAQEALVLRAELGGFAFVMMTHALLGGAYALSGQEDLAVQNLTKAIACSESMGEAFVRAGALAHLAFLYDKLGKRSEGLQYLKKCLEYLADNQYTHFFGWTPKVMTRLLKRAVSNGIQSDYCAHLLREKFNLDITDEGRVVPLLDVEVLEPIRVLAKAVPSEPLKLKKGVPMHLMARLITAPDRALAGDVLEATLWPEKEPLKARRNLDTTLSRMRKQMANQLNLDRPGDYLIVQKRIVALRHVRLDARQFLEHLYKAEEYSAEGYPWLASLSFERAWALWADTGEPFLTDPLFGPLAEDCVRHLIASVAEIGPFYLQHGNASRLTEVILKVLVLSPLDFSLHQQLYRAFLAQGKTLNAQEVINDYHRKLLQNHYSETDAQKMIDQIW